MAMMTATTAAMMELMDMVPPLGLGVTPGASLSRLTARVTPYTAVITGMNDAAMAGIDIP